MYVLFVAPLFLIIWFGVFSRGWVRRGEPESLLRVMVFYRAGTVVAAAITLGVALAAGPWERPAEFLIILPVLLAIFAGLYFLLGAWLSIVLHYMLRRLFAEGSVIHDETVSR